MKKIFIRPCIFIDAIPAQTCGGGEFILEIIAPLRVYLTGDP
jgi:hypothetical protein